MFFGEGYHFKAHFGILAYDAVFYLYFDRKCCG